MLYERDTDEWYPVFSLIPYPGPSSRSFNIIDVPQKLVERLAAAMREFKAVQDEIGKLPAVKIPDPADQAITPEMWEQSCI
jgi:hypothetical protein